MDTITCKHCSRNAVPRLWHEYSENSHRKTQHICLLRGQVLYVTGGNLTSGTKILLSLVGFMLFKMTMAVIQEKFNPPPVPPPAACKGSAVHCKAAVVKQN